MSEVPNTHRETTTKICMHDFSLNNRTVWGGGGGAGLFPLKKIFIIISVLF